MIPRYCIYLIADLVVSGVSMILAPIIVLFAEDSGWLPSWLWWFQTPGDSLDGSAGWQTKDRWFLVEDRRWKRWSNRVGWLWRNSAYGFSIDILGAQAQPGDMLVTTGDHATSNHDPFHPGTVRHVLMRNGRPVYFQTYIVKPWLFGWYFRGNFGWKLWSMPTADRMQFTFSPNPFRKIA